MQTLGISDSTPKPENRLKSLFWPAIRHETDVDYVTRQGFWVCFVVAVFSLVFALAQQNSIVTGIVFLEAVFFFLCGVGSRMRSVFAAGSAFTIYLLSSFLVPFSIIRILFSALLLANARGTWISSRWSSVQVDPPPLPLNESVTDKLVDRMPAFLWRYMKLPFYFLAVFEAGLMAVIMIRMLGTRS